MEPTAHSSKKYLIGFIFIATTAGIIFISGCIFKEPQVGGLNVAFEQGTQDNEINATFEKINFNINYRWFHTNGLGEGYYIIIPEHDLNKVQFLYNLSSQPFRHRFKGNGNLWGLQLSIFPQKTQRLCYA